MVSDLLTAQLLSGFCVIEPQDLPETTAGGIILSDKVERRQMVGIVRNVCATDDPGFTVGDQVVFARWAGGHYEDDDNTLVLMKNDDIYAVVG